MTICKCDRCGKEIALSDLFAVDIRPWDRPTQVYARRLVRVVLSLPVRLGKKLMSLDKSIASGKDHRKPYIGSKAIDPSCRNHGGCPWCEENRRFKFRDKEKDYRDRLQADD